MHNCIVFGVLGLDTFEQVLAVFDYAFVKETAVELFEGVLGVLEELFGDFADFLSSIAQGVVGFCEANDLQQQTFAPEFLNLYVQGVHKTLYAFVKALQHFPHYAAPHEFLNFLLQVLAELQVHCQVVKRTGFEGVLGVDSFFFALHEVRKVLVVDLVNGVKDFVFFVQDGVGVFKWQWEFVSVFLVQPNFPCYVFNFFCRDQS
mmetsp:Transcript_1536/g.2477  ORF Transcript_1536/g.2477 Transcript_1536/m.2477 type:complete len:204 (-) Transcript_1536:63-674(-)